MLLLCYRRKESLILKMIFLEGLSCQKCSCMPVTKLGQNVIRQLSSGTTTNVSGYEDYILLVKTDKFSAVVIKASFEINFNQLNQKKNILSRNM